MELDSSTASRPEEVPEPNQTEPQVSFLGRGRFSSLSTEGFCLSELGIRRLDRSTFRKLWLIAPWGAELRTFARFGNRGEYLVDVVTGTLYNDDGSSATGGHLRLSQAPPRSQRLPAVGIGGA